ncbi:MAG: 50S ribosomal protein L25, partial [Candidatus Colwellbacteria bacterium]|nr:50S ribosomal protein L25 [Candidatus Colwellbacteria bacterium]
MPNLNGEKRDMSVKLEDLRAKGFIPAELYGKGVSNIHLAISAKEFSKLFDEAGENTIVTVEIEGKGHPVLIHGYQIDPICQKYLSV